MLGSKGLNAVGENIPFDPNIIDKKKKMGRQAWTW